VPSPKNAHQDQVINRGLRPPHLHGEKIMDFIVKTQTLENYGAHDTDGKFSSGNAYWKFKGGDDYIVSDVNRPADAMAYIMAAHSSNCISMKVIPTDVMTISQWEDELAELDKDYAVYLLERAIRVSPLKQ